MANIDLLVIAVDMNYEDGPKVLEEWMDEASRERVASLGTRYVAGVTFHGWSQSASVVTDELTEVIGFILYALEGAQRLRGTEYFRIRLQGLRPEAARQVESAIEMRNAAAFARMDVGGHG